MNVAPPQETSEKPPAASLAECFNRLGTLSERDALSLGEFADTLGDRGFGLLLVILSLPSALPLPAAGYSVPFGVVLISLGLQMLAGRVQPWLPAKARKHNLGERTIQTILGAGQRICRVTERLVRPRLKFLQRGWSIRALGALVIFMGLLMCVPIPLTNTAPAGVIFLIGVGLSEEDGLVAAASFVAGVFAVLFYLGVIAAIIFYGPEVIEQLKEQIKAILS